MTTKEIGNSVSLTGSIERGNNLTGIAGYGTIRNIKE
jgi:hypothetical protein